MIRPLVAVTESEARNYAKASALPIIGCCCPACGDLGLQRQRIKRLIAELEVEHPDIKNSMIRALGNVGGAAPARSAAAPAARVERAASRRPARCRCSSSSGEAAILRIACTVAGDRIAAGLV